MSHPWKPQPYYMYREPRTTGTVPAAMGLGNVYARGSFAAKSPWNVPQYVASQPTGLNGFGDDASSCLTDAELEGLAQMVKNAIPRTGCVTLPVVGEQCASDAASVPVIKAAITAASGQFLNLARKGRAAFKEGVGSLFNSILPIPGLGSALASALGDALFDLLASSVQRCQAPAAPTGLTLDVRLKNCKQALVIKNSADYDYSTKMFAEQQYVVNKCAEIMTAPIQLTAEEGRALMQRATQRTTTIARLTAPLTALRVVPPPSPAYAAESKGISPVMLGAVAIAALLLLR